MIASIVSKSIPRNGLGQTLAVGAGVAQFAAFHADATDVLLTVQAANVWVTFDGTDPVAGSAGHILTAGAPPMVFSKLMVAAAKFTRASTDATVTGTPLA